MEVGAAAMHGAETSPCKTMELKWIKTTPKTTINKPFSISPSPQHSSIPIFISTKPSHINLDDLHRLYRACNLSGHRFPTSDGASANARKLRIALSHSAFVVSVFCKPPRSSVGMAELLLQRVAEPVSPSNSDLVGFGRAVSDIGLTASIYDVMVAPSLRGLGIGKMIVHRILRMLASRDIYDIAALCSENERPFFEACGFGDDILGSTTMMYTRTVSASSESEANQMAKRAGRKLLLIPPPLKTPLPSPLDPDKQQ